MIVGIIPCSKKKLAAPAPAYLLYSASPSFTKLLAAAQASCDKVFILSGRHGLLPADKVLAPYEHHAKHMEEGVRRRVKEQCHQLRGEGYALRSWCGSIYNKIIGEPLTVMLEGGLYSRFHAVASVPSAKGREFPIGVLLEYAYLHSGGTLVDLKTFVDSVWSNPTTRYLQYRRLLTSGFVTTVEDRFIYNFIPDTLEEPTAP